MRIDNSVKTEAFTIFDAPKLDPITVVLQDMGTGHGRMMVECFGSAWSAYWGAMGNRTIREFLTACGSDYVVSRMTPSDRRVRKFEEAYLRRIVEATLEALHVHKVEHPDVSVLLAKKHSGAMISADGILGRIRDGRHYVLRAAGALPKRSVMNKVGIVIDGWKLPIFERHLSQAGYAFEIRKGIISGGLILSADTDDLEAFSDVVEAANAEAATTAAPQT